MTVPGALNKIHRQRIGVAVKAALGGDEVTVLIVPSLIGWGGSRLIWRCKGRQHVIATGGKASMEGLLPLAQEEFVRQLAEESLGEERGALV